jgi:signal transduction histidine kinase
MALAAGYGAILFLLVFSGIEAYKLQGARSDMQLRTYQRYLHLERNLSELKRCIWLGGGYAREYFLATGPARERHYVGQVSEMRAQADNALRELRSMEPDRLKRLQVEPRVLELLGWLSALPNHEGPELSALEVVRGEYIPRRIAAFEAVESLIREVQQELHEAEARFADQQAQAARNLIVLLAASLLVGLGVAWSTLRYSARWERERRAHFDQIEHTKQDLEQLSARLLDVQEEERRSLSRELHDEVGQTLTALRMEISQAMNWMQDSPGRDRLARARDLAERTVQTVRNISLMLRPSLLDDLGLEAALQWQVGNFSDRSGIHAELVAVDVDENLPDDLKTCIFRITQEALNNCEKYASARHVRVSLEQQAKGLVLQIADDGVGFRVEDSSQSGGTGLLGMKERVGRLNGRIQIDTQPKHGTKVVVTLPLTTVERKSSPEVAA